LQFSRAHNMESRRQQQTFAPANAQFQPQHQHPVPHEPAEPDTAEPMEIDYAKSSQQNGRFQPKRKPKCGYCKKLGHTTEQCYKRKNRNNGGQQGHGKSQNCPQRNAINYFEDSSGESIATEEISAITQPEFTINEGEMNHFSGKELVVKHGFCDDANANIMLDSGATCNVVKPGFLKRVSDSATIRVTRFDASTTMVKKVKKGLVDVDFDGHTFRNVSVLEWPMKNSHDLILGKPWFTEYLPSINWRTHAVTFPEVEDDIKVVSFAEFNKSVKQNKYNEVYRVKVAQICLPESVTDPQLKALLEQNADILPAKLPDVLPPHRRVEFEMNMKPDAQPSNRPSFRLSQTEQTALMKFVE
jgi:hypothetical protein